MTLVALAIDRDVYGVFHVGLCPTQGGVHAEADLEKVDTVDPQPKTLDSADWDAFEPPSCVGISLGTKLFDPFDELAGVVDAVAKIEVHAHGRADTFAPDFAQVD